MSAPAPLAAAVVVERHASVANPFDDNEALRHYRPQLHDIELQEVPGKGRGYVATRSMRVGFVVFEANNIEFQCKKSGASLDEASAGFARALLRNPATRQVPLTLLCSNPTMAEEYAQTMTPDPQWLRDEMQLSREQWFRAVAAVRVNAWGTMADKDGVLGSRTLCLNLSGSLFNHSCAPNAYLDAQAGRADRVMLIRDVRPGEEVTVAYPSDEVLLRPAALRQRPLQTSWGFACACERCAPERAAEEAKQLATSVDQAVHDRVLSVTAKPTLSEADSLDLQRVIKGIRKCGAFDWRAHAIRQRLLAVQLEADCPLGRVVASHFKVWIKDCARMRKQFLAPASLYKLDAYNTAMQLGPHYGYTRREVLDALVSVEPWYASDEFVRIYQPAVTPAAIATAAAAP